MGHVDTVLDTLLEEGVRAERSYPGSTMPQLQYPAATVHLEKADDKGEMVCIVMLTPGARGGGFCETASLDLLSIVKTTGGVCSLDKLAYDGKNHLFYGEIRAFFPAPVEEEPSPYNVMLGVAPLHSVTGFKSWHLTDEPETAPLNTSLCYFRIEEQVVPGQQEQNTPAEPFTMKVTRLGCEETFYGCRLTSDVREDGKKGITRVRSGTATSRAIISIL